MNSAPKSNGKAVNLPAPARLEGERFESKLDGHRRRLEQLEGVFSNIAEAIFVAEPEGRLVDVNPAACALLGYSKSKLLTMYPWDFVTSASRAEIRATLDGLKSGAVSSVQRACRSKLGEEKIIELRLARSHFSGRDLIIASCRDVTEQQRARMDLEHALDERKRTEALLEREKKMLERVASGRPLPEIFDQLCRGVEEVLKGSLTVIMLMDPDGKRLRSGAAPSMPEFLAAVDGFEIDPDIGTCSAAAARRKPVFTENIATDPHWDGYRELAFKHGVQAGWATPILSSAGSVLGTFSLYWPEPRRPTPQHLKIVDQIGRLLSFAIERKQAAEALQASEKLARGQADALARTLDTFARESEPDRLLEHLLRTIVELMTAEGVGVWERDPNSDWVERFAAIEGGRFQSRDGAMLPPVRLSTLAQDHVFWSKILRDGLHAVIEDISEPVVRVCVGSSPGAVWHDILDDVGLEPGFFRFKSHLRAMGVRTILFVPMIISGRVTGLIAIRFAARRVFQPEEIDLARALANQTMLAIQLTRLSAQSRQSAVMAERNRMARDIHDTLAQGFTGVIMQLEAAKGATIYGDLAEATNRIVRASELARSSLGEARRSIRALRPSSLRHGRLSLAIADMLKQMTEGTGLNAVCRAEGDPLSVPVEWEEELLRITQEALANTIKHSQARNFRAILHAGADRFQLRLEDDGRGFDPEHNHDGMGLIGIKERVDRMGGKLTLATKPTGGAEIMVALENRSPPKPENGVIL